MFLTAMFLFVRILPMISIFEMRTLLPEAEVKARMKSVTPIYGMMAEFDSASDLVAAAQQDPRSRLQEDRRLQPFPGRRIGGSYWIPQERRPAGGADRRHHWGVSGGYLMQYWISVISYPGECRWAAAITPGRRSSS